MHEHKENEHGSERNQKNELEFLYDNRCLDENKNISKFNVDGYSNEDHLWMKIKCKI